MQKKFWPAKKIELCTPDLQASCNQAKLITNGRKHILERKRGNPTFNSMYFFATNTNFHSVLFKDKRR